MKNIVKQALRSFGYNLTRIDQRSLQAGSDRRPVGEMDLLLEDLQKRGLDCKSILDVGANWSGWSRMAKRIFPSANFCLIEPQIEMEEQLKIFCKEFEGSIYILAGAGEGKGIRTFTIWDDLNGSSFLPMPDQQLKNVGSQRDIEMVTIDELIESSRIKIPELIKLDIQGFELEALKGAAKTFGHTDVYIMEVSLFAFSETPGLPLFPDVVDFMRERGYVIYDFGGFSRRPLDGALAQCDVCFVKKEGFLRRSSEWK